MGQKKIDPYIILLLFTIPSDALRFSLFSADILFNALSLIIEIVLINTYSTNRYTTEVFRKDKCLRLKKVVKPRLTSSKTWHITRTPI